VDRHAPLVCCLRRVKENSRYATAVLRDISSALAGPG
jgi:hypothetical protein